MITKDFFLSKITKKKIFKSFDKKDFKKIKFDKPFFLSLKLKKKLPKKKLILLKPHFACKQYVMRKNFKNTKEEVSHSCRFYKKQDINQVLKISKQNTSYSRFVKDKLFKKFLKFPFRYYWLRNFFKGNLKNNLIVCQIKNKITGFLLLKKTKKKLTIDLICTSKNYGGQKIASSMIAYVHNRFMIKDKLYLIAGTQNYNTAALKFYKKNNFKKTDKMYIYHSIIKN